MKVLAKDLKNGDEIFIGGKQFFIESIEISDIGKQGKRKVRIEAQTSKGEDLVVIRPEDYPFEMK